MNLGFHSKTRSVLSEFHIYQSVFLLLRSLSSRQQIASNDSKFKGLPLRATTVIQSLLELSRLVSFCTRYEGVFRGALTPNLGPFSHALGPFQWSLATFEKLKDAERSFDCYGSINLDLSPFRKARIGQYWGSHVPPLNGEVIFPTFQYFLTRFRKCRLSCATYCKPP